jgi:uncharacterized integral membrane protein
VSSERRRINWVFWLVGAVIAIVVLILILTYTLEAA